MPLKSQLKSTHSYSIIIFTHEFYTTYKLVRFTTEQLSRGLYPYQIKCIEMFLKINSIPRLQQVANNFTCRVLQRIGNNRKDIILTDHINRGSSKHEPESSNTMP